LSKNAVFLDAESLGKGFSLSTLNDLPLHWTFYPATSPIDVVARIETATIVVTNKVRLNKEILKQAPNLKLICVSATGYDNIDLEAAKSLGIPICNIPAYSTSSVIQLTWALILALFNNLIAYAEATRKGLWQKSPQFCMLDYPITEVEGKILGIVGYGNIGKGVARCALAFGMQILIAQHTDPSRAMPGALPLEELLQKVDVVTFHLPLTSKTRNLVAAKELSLMKPYSFLVNVSRGGIVNEPDLAMALERGRLAGAALDVLSSEPPPENHPLLQKKLPNLILTPHIGWGSLESRLRLLRILKENISSFLNGKPQNKVNA
jgi:glycerate dehydrogenase